jgi:hypothetical protein
MASQGPFNPTAASGWANPTFCFTSNGAYASITQAPSEDPGPLLRATGFGFTIPTGATVTGIEVTIEHNSGSPNTMILREAYLVKAGGRIGVNQSGSQVAPSTDTVITVGSSTNLWGTTWTTAQINAANFGVEVSYGNPEAGTTQQIEIDHITIKVYYFAYGTLNFTGFESGLLASGSDKYIANGSGGSLVTTPVHGGDYAYRCNCTTSTNANLQFDNAGSRWTENEIFVRFYFRLAANTTGPELIYRAYVNNGTPDTK